MAFALTTMFVSDMERSLAFYRDVLGLPVVGTVGEEKDEFRISFLGDAEGTRLELIQGAGTPRPSESISVGFTPANLEDILEQYRNVIDGPTSPNPHTTFWNMRDPDGYRVMLLKFT